MSDLSHWDFASCFTGREAAFLIMGVDPSNDEVDSYNPHHILNRIKIAYDGAITLAKSEASVELSFPFDFDIEPALPALPAEALYSEQLLLIINKWRTTGNVEKLTRWLQTRSNFLEQKFSRLELSRWIAVLGLNSTCKFGNQYPQQSQSASASKSNDKPLAKRERDTLLTMIAALCCHSKIEYQERGAAGKIASMTQDIGAPVSDDTIRDVLSKIPDALESRIK